MAKKLLVPFCDPCDLQEILAAALKGSGQIPTEIILLRVDLPACPQTGSTDCECLYSELKALQAQLQTASIPVRLDTMPGKRKDAIRRYAQQNKIDLIFTGHAPFLFKSSRSFRGQPAA